MVVQRRCENAAKDGADERDGEDQVLVTRSQDERAINGVGALECLDLVVVRA